jgi:hypothetical protein
LSGVSATGIQRALITGGAGFIGKPSRKTKRSSVRPRSGLASAGSMRNRSPVTARVTISKAPRAPGPPKAVST